LILRVLALLAVLVPARAGDDPAALARSARDLRREGKPAEALALFESKPPELLADLRVAGERIQCLLDAGRGADALAVDAAVGKVKEGPTPLGVARARLATLHGQPKAALAWTEAAGPLHDQPDVVQTRIEALLALDRTVEADSAVKLLPTSMPAPMRDRLDVDVRLARARGMLEDPDLIERVIPMLEDALTLQPARDAVKVVLVEALGLFHHEDRAETLAKEVLDRAQGADRVPMLLALGNARRAELRDDDAAKCLEEALALQPDSARATVALARCRLRQGREDEGLKLLHDRLARSPHDADALLALAEHQLENREAQAAADALRDVLTQRPGSLKALYMLSRALAALGQTEEQKQILADWQKRRDALALK